MPRYRWKTENEFNSIPEGSLSHNVSKTTLQVLCLFIVASSFMFLWDLCICKHVCLHLYVFHVLFLWLCFLICFFVSSYSGLFSFLFFLRCPFVSKKRHKACGSICHSHEVLVCCRWCVKCAHLAVKGVYGYGHWTVSELSCYKILWVLFYSWTIGNRGVGWHTGMPEAGRFEMSLDEQLSK